MALLYRNPCYSEACYIEVVLYLCKIKLNQCFLFKILQIWDPFTGDIVQQLESSKYSPVIALATLPSPSTVVVTATTDSTLR